MSSPDLDATGVTGEALVVILGAGRLGLHLSVHLRRAGVARLHLWNRSALEGQRLEMALAAVAGTGRPALSIGALPVTAIQTAAVVLVTVADGAVVAVSRRIAREAGPVHCPVLHCSGAFPGSIMAPLAAMGTPVGSLHPLRSFASDTLVENLGGTWFALEGDRPAVAAGRKLVERLGGKPMIIESSAKVAYHAAAVMASNLVVALVSVAIGVLEQGLRPPEAPGTGLEMILSLVEGTVANLKSAGLPGALTGPVSRGDSDTVARHLEALEPCASPDLAAMHATPADVYRVLSLHALALAREQGLPAEVCETVRNALAERATLTGQP